jgi:hypothetical protein
MGYFLDYELFTPCYRCGRTECNGNCALRGEPVAYEPTVTHHERGFGHESCNCHICRNMRERAANRG